MNRWIMFMVVALGACLPSCQSPGKGGDGPCRPNVTPKRSTAARVIDVKPLVLGQTYKIDKVLRLADVAGPRRAWRILVGPNPCGGVATLRYSNSEPDIYVQNGWAYVEVRPQSDTTTAPEPGTGSGWGQARTDRVSGTADGTRFIVQEQGGIHRVILLSGPHDRVHVVLDGQQNQARNLTTARTYFEVCPSDTVLPPAQTITDPNSPVGLLVDYVEDVGGIAGMN